MALINVRSGFSIKHVKDVRRTGPHMNVHQHPHPGERTTIVNMDRQAKGQGYIVQRNQKRGHIERGIKTGIINDITVPEGNVCLRDGRTERSAGEECGVLCIRRFGRCPNPESCEAFKDSESLL